MQASPDSIAGAIGACVSKRKNVRAEPGDKNASLEHRLSPTSLDGRKRCENASVETAFYPFSGNQKRRFSKTY